MAEQRVQFNIILFLFSFDPWDGRNDFKIWPFSSFVKY